MDVLKTVAEVKNKLEGKDLAIGMSRRDFIAAMVISGLSADSPTESDIRLSVEVADKLIYELDVEGESHAE